MPTVSVEALARQNGFGIRESISSPIHSEFIVADHHATSMGGMRQSVS
jgi:hypothetical protein